MYLLLELFVNGSILKPYWLASKKRDILSHVGHDAGDPQSLRYIQTIVMMVHGNVRSNFVPLARILRSVRYVHKWMFVSSVDTRLMVHGPETFKRIKTISQTWMYMS